MLKFLWRKFAPSDPEQYLSTDHLMADLKGRSVRGGIATLGSSWFKFVLQMGTTVVLARLLLPEDYGLVGMSNVIIEFIEIFKDMGLSEATVQRTEVNHKQVSTLFWLNLGLAVTLALLVIAISPLIARFYQEPRVQNIMVVLSLNFIFSGLTVQHNALIKRQMQFIKLAQITAISNLIGPTVGIISAWMGNGYWALVHMFVTSNLCYMFAVWITCSWRPGIPDFKSGIGSMLKFGGNLTGYYTLNYLSRNFDNFLIGRFWGAQELGFYAKAYQLVLLPIYKINQPLTSVVMPALSRLQTDPEKYQVYYYKALILLTSIGMPLVCFLFSAANEIILLLLGEQWQSTTILFRWLMPAAFISTFYAVTGWVFQSLDQTDRQFRWGIFSSTFDIITFLIGIKWGALGVAVAYGSTRPIITIISIHYCFSRTFLRVKDFWLTISKPTIASFAATALVLVCEELSLASVNNFLSFSLKGFLFAGSYILFLRLIPGGKLVLSEILNIKNYFRE